MLTDRLPVILLLMDDATGQHRPDGVFNDVYTPHVSGLNKTRSVAGVFLSLTIFTATLLVVIIIQGRVPLSYNFGTPPPSCSLRYPHDVQTIKIIYTCNYAEPAMRTHTFRTKSETTEAPRCQY